MAKRIGPMCVIRWSPPPPLPTLSASGRINPALRHPGAISGSVTLSAQPRLTMNQAKPMIFRVAPLIGSPGRCSAKIACSCSRGNSNRPTFCPTIPMEIRSSAEAQQHEFRDQLPSLRQTIVHGNRQVAINRIASAPKAPAGRRAAAGGCRTFRRGQACLTRNPVAAPTRG